MTRMKVCFPQALFIGREHTDASCNSPIYADEHEDDEKEMRKVLAQQSKKQPAKQQQKQQAKQGKQKQQPEPQSQEVSDDDEGAQLQQC